MMRWAKKTQGTTSMTREDMMSSSTSLPPREVVFGRSRTRGRASKVEEEVEKEPDADISSSTIGSSSTYSMSGSLSSSEECKHVTWNSNVVFKASTSNSVRHDSCYQHEECGICSEPLHGGLRFVGACHPCGHCFHEDCFFGAWTSSLLHDEGAAKGEHSVNWISAQCMQCESMVGDFERIAVGDGDDEGDYDSISLFELDSNEFDALFAKAKMKSLVRRCLSGPSSPTMVFHALRLIMDRIHESNNNEVKAEFLAVGGHMALMHAVARYSEEEDVWDTVNAVLAQLANGYSHVLYITTPNLPLFIASSMFKHPEHEQLQSNGCCTFSELCKSSFGSKQAFQDIIKANGLAAVTAAIVRFPLEATSLHRNAISFLALAAEIDPMLVCEHVCSDKEALDVIVTILLESSISSSSLTGDTPNMGRLVCTILRIAARYPKFRGAIIKSGGAEALQAVHMGSSDVPCQTMSVSILKMLGRPLVPEGQSSSAFI